MIILQSIKKVLSRNDVGINGSHQSGILVPKRAEILSYFPILQVHIKNPRKVVMFLDDNNNTWHFTFIYYNNRFFGGTRNEYRLTGMASFFRRYGLKDGDEIVFILDNSGQRHVRHNHLEEFDESRENVIRLSNKWVVIKI